MAKSTVTLTNATPAVLDIAAPVLGNMFYEGTIIVKGSFGSPAGTLALTISDDNGVTQIPLKDVNGNAISAVAALGMYNVRLGGDATALRIYATITGATAPSLIVSIFDTNL